MSQSNPTFKKSIYSTLFNYKTNKFNVDDHLSNFSIWPDEVIIATIDDEDDTYSYLLSKEKEYPKLKVLKTALKRFTPTFDGDLKDAALQACSGDILLQLDFDEKMSVHNLYMWDKLSEIILGTDDFSASFVPSVNLYKDTKHLSSFTPKWYLHKRGLKRGVVNFAKNPNGTPNTEKSDSCELLNKDGDLVPSFLYFDQSLFKNPTLAAEFMKEQDLPYVIHFGWIDLDRRVEINKNFWKKQWDAEAGKSIDIPMSKDAIESAGDKCAYEHKLIVP